MSRYQLRRPPPIKIYSRWVRRQGPPPAPAPGPGEEGEEEVEEVEELEEVEEEEEGPESPDSLFSSPSTVGALSEGEDSESEDEGEEAPSSIEGDAPPGPPNGTEPASPSLPIAPGASAPTPALSIAPDASSQAPSLTLIASQGGNFAAVPQITGTASTTGASQASITATTVSSSPSGVTRPSNPAPTSSEDSSPTPGSAGESDIPQRSSPQEDKTLISKGAAAAAITLSILGAVAIILAALIYFKRRKRREKYNQRLADDAFDPGNTGSLHAPETAHIATTSVFGGGGGNSHMTRSTDRSDTLFGAGPYMRPETVTTDRNKSRFPGNIEPPQPTPNPFVDPPLNKAYDVLAGRPRSTTLTDRGSWVQNPFKDPESERFDPFGELQQKARDERKRYLEASRKEAEAAREAEEARQFGEKARMRLTVPEEARRKGSRVTIEGLGILDRSGGGGGYKG